MRTLKFILLLFVAYQAVKSTEVVDYSTPAPFQNPFGANSCIYNGELSSLNDFYTWECQTSGELFYTVTSESISNKEAYYLSQDDWSFIFVNTEYNDYQLFWEEISEAVSKAVKEAEDAEHDSPKPVPAAGKDSDVVITVDGKDLIITAQNIE